MLLILALLLHVENVYTFYHVNLPYTEVVDRHTSDSGQFSYTKMSH